MRIYLDNCCYNRPYDDQSQTRIHLEAQAKMQIKQMIKNQEIELVTSYILEYDYFITVDDRLLKYQTKEMPLITPIDFINKWRN